MTVPLLPIPGRPVDDAIIETAWGAWAHDNAVYAMQGAPHARVYRTAAQTIPNNAATAVSWQAARNNVGPLWAAGAPTRLTVADPGWYSLGMAASFATNASGIRQITARVNGTLAVAVDSRVPPPGAIFPVEMTLGGVELQLAAGDYLEFVVYQNSGGNLALEARSMLSPEAWLTWHRA